MFRNIRAIFFDIGETLGVRKPDMARQAAAVPRMLDLLGIDQSPETWRQELEMRYEAYVAWRQESLIEVCEQELWARWLLPDLPVERTRAHALELTRLWRSLGGKRDLRDDVPATIRELVNRGYRLGIISNTVTSQETPACLEEHGLSDCFSTILLSCAFGRRKPDPTIFWEAARQVGVQPEWCAYVGDRPSRDVAGPRRAGYALTIMVADSPYVEVSTDPFLEPDIVIHRLAQLLDLFAPISALANANGQQLQ